MTGRKWLARAVCGQMDPETFDAVFFGRWTRQGQRLFAEDVERARAVCEACPVLFECLDDVLRVPAWHDRDGIRAGLLPEERATLREDDGRNLLPHEEVWTGGDPHGERLKWARRRVAATPPVASAAGHRATK